MTARRMFFALIVAYAGVHGAVHQAIAQQRNSDGNTASPGVVTATWIGPATFGLWSDPANWDTADFPNNGNGGVNYDVRVSFPGDANAPPVINLDISVVIESLFLRGTLDAQSGSANLTINGPWDWQTGRVLGPGTTTANGGITTAIFSSSFETVVGGGRILENAGLTVLQNTLIIADGARLNNLVGGTINPKLGITTTNGGVANNFGLIFTESAQSIFGVFNNHGSVEVRTGSSLTLRSSGTHSGAFHVAIGAFLLINADTGVNEFTATSDITGPGDVVFTSGDVINYSGGLSLTGTVTTNAPELNFANPPTSVGFTLEIPSGLPTIRSPYGR